MTWIVGCVFVSCVPEQPSVLREGDELGQGDWVAQADSHAESIPGSDAGTLPDADADVSIGADNDGELAVVIEEQGDGFCLVDGVVESKNTGFSGSGYANTDNAVGMGVEWAIDSAGGPVRLEWRYASVTDRPASLIVNGSTVASPDFATTLDWASWSLASSTAELVVGDNQIRLEALSSEGLANIDNLTVFGAGTAPGTCSGGTLPGPDTDLIGWASVRECGPNGTTGGGDGEPTVTVTSGSELKNALTASGAAIIAVSGRVDSPGSISGVSDKTLIGLDNAEVSGGFGLKGARNVIINNIRFSDGADDTFELSGCECIWFDHCEFSDGADGNLDIVRAANLVTVSWSKFFYTRGHDHMLSNLCGNTQPKPEDEGKINITFHHNWWGAGVKSRAPRVRYGKVHVFNNYYHYEKVAGDGGEDYCIGAGYMSKLLVENNYFDGSRSPIIWMADEGTGEVVETGNQYVDTGAVVTRGSSFDPPYEYSMDPPSRVKDIVTAGAGVE